MSLKFTERVQKEDRNVGMLPKGKELEESTGRANAYREVGGSMEIILDNPMSELQLLKHTHK